MAHRTAVLISNPKTGRYNSKRRTSLEEVRDHLASRGVDAELVITSHAGDAAGIARRATDQGVMDVIAAGGDGTINEVLQGLVGTSARLGIIPRGTANVLARELKLPLDNLKAADAIAAAKTQRVHIGKATEESSDRVRYFILMAGIGLDASVIRRVRPSLKKRFGQAAFWLSGISHLVAWKPKPFTISVNDHALLATFAVIGKSPSYGGQLSITPRVRLAQPDFEVCVIGLRSRLRYLQLLPQVMQGGIRGASSAVNYFQTTRVIATGDAPVQLDGELFGSLPMTFEVAPEWVEVIIP